MSLYFAFLLALAAPRAAGLLPLWEAQERLQEGRNVHSHEPEASVRSHEPEANVEADMSLYETTIAKALEESGAVLEGRVSQKSSASQKSNATRAKAKRSRGRSQGAFVQKVEDEMLALDRDRSAIAARTTQGSPTTASPIFEPLLDADFVLDADNYLEVYGNASRIVEDAGAAMGASAQEVQQALSEAAR
mmetsp:Transcript_968/g.2664  ORF Transcript_968/g.2664 Transcript_968/m.2664 type:complete len:191 (-) Transcript_968:61-633(-)